MKKNECRHIVATFRRTDDWFDTVFMLPISRYQNKIQAMIKMRMLFSKDANAFKFECCPLCEEKLDWAKIDDSLRPKNLRKLNDKELFKQDIKKVHRVHGSVLSGSSNESGRLPKASKRYK